MSENVKTSYLLLLQGDIHGNPLLFLKISFHIGRIRIRNDNSGSEQNIPDPTGSGSGSATLILGNDRGGKFFQN